MRRIDLRAFEPAGDLLGAARQRIQRVAESRDEAFVERLGRPAKSVAVRSAAASKRSLMIAE